jgi:hypothetical protein
MPLSLIRLSMQESPFSSKGKEKEEGKGRALGLDCKHFLSVLAFKELLALFAVAQA